MYVKAGRYQLPDANANPVHTCTFPPWFQLSQTRLSPVSTGHDDTVGFYVTNAIYVPFFSLISKYKHASSRAVSVQAEFMLLSAIESDYLGKLKGY